MARKVQHHICLYGEKTQTNWAKEGYIVKKGREGQVRWTNAYCQQTAVYYSKDDVRKDKVWAERFLKEQRQKKLEKQRTERATQRSHREKDKSVWNQLFVTPCKIVIFDTETSGLSSSENVILSLSWQVLDNKLAKIKERTYFFDWPEDVSRVTQGAIDINGLTRERLAELGTSDKQAALQEFADDVQDAIFLVAHNAKFDIGFIVHENKEYDIDSVILQKPVYDTMKEMTDYVGIPGHNARYMRGYGWTDYKWPRLSELANKLKIRQDDIDYHQSAADVEVTVRCLRAIIRRGIERPTLTMLDCVVTRNYTASQALRIAKAHNKEKQVSSFIKNGHFSPDRALLVWGIYPVEK